MSGSEGAPSLDSANVSRFHWALSTLAGMGALIDGYDLSVVSFSVLLVSSQFGIKSGTLSYSLVLSSALIGMAIGGVLFGRLADRLGRRTMFMLNLVFFVVFAILSSLSSNVYELIGFRILMGIGIGADYPISSTLISEYAPAKRRGQLLAYGIMYYWVGALLSGIVNYFALYLGLDLSWRVALAFGGVLAIPVIVARGVVPESVRWLASSNRLDEAKKISSTLGFKPPGPAGRSSAKDLFTKYFRGTLFLLVAWFAFDLGAYGFGFYTPTLYHTYGIHSLSEIALFGAANAPFPILAYFVLMKFIDRYGRRILMVAGFAAMIVVLIALPGLLTVSPFTLLPAFIVYSSLEQWPGGILSYVYSTELYPTPIRALGQGLATSVSRIGAIAGVILFPLLSKSGLFVGTGFFAAIILVALLVTVFLAPETSEKTLEEITGGVSREGDSG
jgi:PHS family inorganic phosphate transporter-like MFS transporter